MGDDICWLWSHYFKHVYDNIGAIHPKNNVIFLNPNVVCPLWLVHIYSNPQVFYSINNNLFVLIQSIGLNRNFSDFTGDNSPQTIENNEFGHISLVIIKSNKAAHMSDLYTNDFIVIF